VGRLIVNADDFGLTQGVNRAVAELHAAGAVTSATLMAQGTAGGEAIALALKTPSLGVGCHVVLVDGKPALSPSDIPHLADQSNGHFRPTLWEFLRAVHSHGPWTKVSALDSEIEAETAAQIAQLQARGLRLTHVDTHKHTHMFPAVLRPVLRAARAAGIRTVRNPFEPAWSRRATPRSALLRRAQLSLLQHLQPTFRRIVAEEGFTTTDGAIGVLATGQLDAALISALLRDLPEGTWELVTHPGANDADLDRVRTRLRASREIERRALQSIQPRLGLDMISFAQLSANGTPPQ
jgi:hopanoid biosynthesis associated protein HpnK